MPDHSKPNQPSLRTGRSAGQVKHQAHQLPQRHSSVVYHTPSTYDVYAPVYKNVGLLSVPLIAAVLLSLFFRVALASFSRRVSQLVPRPSLPHSTRATFPYKRAESLLTPTEAIFYASLRTAIGPLAVIQCKVRLGDLLLAPDHEIAAVRKVTHKHCDFVVCQRLTLRPLVAVELDDPSHNRPDRIERDRFVDAAYAAAGLPLVHIRTQREYHEAELLTLLQPFLV